VTESGGAVTESGGAVTESGGAVTESGGAVTVGWSSDRVGWSSNIVGWSSNRVGWSSSMLIIPTSGLACSPPVGHVMSIRTCTRVSPPGTRGFSETQEKILLTGKP